MECSGPCNGISRMECYGKLNVMKSIIEYGNKGIMLSVMVWAVDCLVEVKWRGHVNGNGTKNGVDSCMAWVV